MNSNAAQFARRGYPWASERDRAALPDYTGRKIRRSAPGRADARPEFREEGYVRRALTAEEERARKHRANLAAIRSAARRRDKIAAADDQQPKRDNRSELSREAIKRKLAEPASDTMPARQAKNNQSA